MNDSSFDCYYQNVSGLCSKTVDLFNASLHCHYSIIAITETWLNDSIYNAELFDASRFDVFRKDRDFTRTGTRRGGGVILAVRKELSAVPVDFNCCEIPFIDVIIVKVKLNFRKIYIINIYVAPQCSTLDLDRFVHKLASVVELFSSSLLILGDFNITEFYDCYNGQQFTNNFNTVMNLANLFSLDQCNQILNDNNRLLDLVFSSVNCVVNRASEVVLPEHTLHHPSLEIQISAAVKTKNFPVVNNNEWNFRKADYPNLYHSILVTDWSFIQMFSDPEEASLAFYRKLTDLFNQTVPKKRKCLGNYPRWYNAQIIYEIKKKTKVFAKYKKTGHLTYLQNFRTIRANLKFKIRSAYITYVNNIETQIKEDPKSFWQFFKFKSGSAVPRSLIFGDRVVDDPQDIVNSFATIFSNAFTSPGSGTDYLPVPNTILDALVVTDINGNDVYDAIKKLKPTMTMGPDLIPSVIVRDCAAVFSPILTYIFKLILKTCKFPSLWKLSKVYPVHKKGSMNSASNFRPITIIPNFAKVFEIYIHGIIYRHVLPALSEHQHGFIKGRSTVSNLVYTAQYLSDFLDARGQVDVVYTDLSKAFDRIDYAILLKKLDCLGLSDVLLSLIGSYLSGRRLFVQCNGFVSAEFTQLSGVPQGSVLGPLFFDIYINDIASTLKVDYLLYADDLKLMWPISSYNDCLVLQNAIHTVSKWCSDNKLQLNIDKCQIISFSRKLNTITFNYEIQKIYLQRSEQVNDLGIIFDSQLTFNPHLQYIMKSAFRSLGFLMRNCKNFRNQNTLILGYTALVRSKLEYASVVWSPLYALHIDRLENIQRRFLKFTVFVTEGFYPPQGFPQAILLEKFKIMSLARRRDLHAAIFIFKLLRNNIKCSHLLSQLNFYVPRLSSRSCSTFYMVTPRTNVLINSPLHRSCEVVNKCQDEIDIFFCSVSELKKLFCGT